MYIPYIYIYCIRIYNIDAASLLGLVLRPFTRKSSGSLDFALAVTAVVACRARVGREKVKCQAWSSSLKET